MLWDLPRQRQISPAYRNITDHETQRLRVHLAVAIAMLSETKPDWDRLWARPP